MATADQAEMFVKNELDQFAGVLPRILLEAQKKAAKAAVKSLKNTSPTRTKEYSKGWKSKTTETRLGASTTIYNGRKPGLAHLLEFGHPKVNGGRTKPFPHIKKVEEDAMDAYEKAVKEGVENDT